MAETILNSTQDNSRPGKGCIAVIDDDYRVVESLDDLLQSSGYRTQLHDSAESFLDAPARDSVDVLISDIGLPGMSGIELLRKLKLEARCPPTILITGRGEAHFEQEALELGVLRLFLKPFDSAELLALIDAQFTK
jgi:two-component system response regulator FixJ